MSHTVPLYLKGFAATYLCIFLQTKDLCVLDFTKLLLRLLLLHTTLSSQLAPQYFMCAYKEWANFAFYKMWQCLFMAKRKRGKFCTLLQSVQLLGMTQPLIVKLGRVGFRAFYAQRKTFPCFGLFICKIPHNPSIASTMNWYVFDFWAKF